MIDEGLPIYHAERMILETGESFGDDQHILYVNAQIKDETELGKLMHDMWCVEPEDMHYGILAERVRYFKENEEGVATMCRAMEQLRNETAEATAFRTTLNAIRELMKNCSWTAEQALLNLGVPEQEHPRYLAAI